MDKYCYKYSRGFEGSLTIKLSYVYLTQLSRGESHLSRSSRHNQAVLPDGLNIISEDLPTKFLDIS